MHRSGTSAVAGALSRSGFFLGEPDALLAHQVDNPRGFWERRDVVAYNQMALEAAQGDWFIPPREDLSPVQSGDNPAAIVQALQGHTPWLIKDPRLALTWPLWRDALGDARRLFVVRDPLAVAASLQRRNGFPIQMGLLLWEYYNLQLLRLYRPGDLVLHFDALIAEPELQWQRLCEWLEPGVSSNLPDSLDFSLPRTTEVSNGELLTLSQRALADQWLALADGTSPPGELPSNPPMMLAQLRDYGNSLRLLERAGEVSRERVEYLADRDRALAALEELTQTHEALAEAYRRDEIEREQLRSRCEALNAQCEALQAVQHRLYEVQDALDQRREAHEASMRQVYQLERSRHPLYLFNLVGERLLHLGRRMLGMERSSEKPPFEVGARIRPRSKWVLAADITRYVLRNPAGSARSFSIPRLKRTASVFLHSNPEDLTVWVDARFPQNELVSKELGSITLDAAYDTLKLDFPRCSEPLVSIIVPVYNEYRMTMQCLQYVLQHSVGIEYEVILADDMSSDHTRDIESRVRNITVVRGDQNRGFVENCNAGAELARGKYLLFLNNDTCATAGWLDALCQVLEEDDSVGVVGPKLLFPTGQLQEAGGIIWEDGSGWNYGREDDPDKPQFNYRRETDYVSGACLMIRHHLWRQLGGFDTRYVPAYYEDTDLCFATRAAGHKVIYQPASQIYHFEGISNGVDLEGGLKKYQVDNQHKFVAKWREVLQRDHFPNGEHVFSARDRSRGQRSVLIIDHYVPHYDKDAGSRSTFMYIQLLLEMGYNVKFLGANFFPHKPYTQTLQQLGVEVLVGEWMARNQDYWLQKHAPYIDCIYLHRPHIAEQVLDSLYKMEPRPPIIYFGHDLHYLRTQREMEVSGNGGKKRDAMSWRRREYAVFDRVDKVYYPSEVEIEEIREHRPDLSLRAIPLYVLPDREPPLYDPQERQDLLFVGGFNHPPNVDGICWFVEEVMPRVLAERPGLQLHVVGSNPTDAVLELQSDHVRVYGYLPDEELDALYRQVRQAVVPLRFGAGVKGKVIEALQQGVPLTTTTIGAEGIPDAAEVMNITDDAEAMAEILIEVDRGSDAAISRTHRYAAYLQRHFSRSQAATILREDFGDPKQPGALPSAEKLPPQAVSGR